MTFNESTKIKIHNLYGGYDWTDDHRFVNPRVKGKYKKQCPKFKRILEKQLTRKKAQSNYLN